jgi:hypothetical protein
LDIRSSAVRACIIAARAYVSPAEWSMMWTMPYLYHMCADDFRGDELLPLNLLALRFPEIHDREMRKWAGRESVIRFAVPHLGVTWGDTVNLAALDPIRLVEA